MKAITLAIDFGTTRTKVAWFDMHLRESSLVELARAKGGVLPSVFYLPLAGTGRILVGDAAQAMAGSDPAGLVEKLKLDLHKPGKIRLGTGRTAIERDRLAAELFRYIRERCQKEVFPDLSVTACCLTIPSAFGEPQREAIRRAAELGGFRDITLLEEPVAVAQAWLAGTGQKISDHALVCDAGGTTDLTLVHLVNGRFRPDPRVIPEETHPPVTSENEAVARLVEATRLFARKCADAGARNIPILLTGGGARMKGLKEAVEQLKLGPVFLWSQSEFAAVLGAAAHNHTTARTVAATDRPAPSPATEPRGPNTAAQRTSVVGKCAKCGTVNPGDNRFCAECGVTLYETCPACEAENRVGIKFCGQCGVDLVRHRRHTDQRRQARDLGTRAGQLPPAHATPLLRQAAGLWNTLLAETPDDTDGQTARKATQAQLRAVLLRQAQELTDQATAQPPATAVPLLRQADGVLDDLLAEFPACEPARTARQKLQREIPARLLQEAQGLAVHAGTLPSVRAVPLLRKGTEILKPLLVEFPDYEPAQIVRQELLQQIPARMLQEAQGLAAQAAPLPPEQAVPLLRKGAEILKPLLAEFPDYEPAQIVRQELQQQLPARLLQQVQALTADNETLQPATAVSMLRKGDEQLKVLLAEFPDHEPSNSARQELQRQLPTRLLQAPQELLRQASQASPESALPVLKQAVTELRLVQAEFPHSVPAHETLEQAVAQLHTVFLEHARSQPPPGVVGSYREMLEHFPGDVEATAGLEQELCTLRQRGAELIDRGHFPEALAHLTEALAKAPTDGELRALKDQAEKCREQFEALNKAMTFHLEARRYLAALPLLGEMVALCPESEDLVTRRNQASQAVEAARQQTEEGNRLLRRGRFFKARKTCGAAVNTCADDFRAQGSLQNATRACLLAGFVATALLAGMAWSGLALLDRRAWADTQAAVQAAGTDGKKAEQLYSAYLQRQFKTTAATIAANEGIAEIRQRPAKIAALLAAAKANNSMENAWKGLASLKSLFELDSNHAEAKQLLPGLKEQERRRQARIAELLAEAERNGDMTNAWRGLANLNALFDLEASHAEAKKLLPILQGQERRRQARIAELLAEAERNRDMTNALKGVENLTALLALDADHAEAKQLRAVLQEQEGVRQTRIAELFAEAKANANPANALKGMESLKLLFGLDTTHAEAKKLLPVLQEEERRRQASIAVLLAEAKASISMTKAGKGLASLNSLFILDANHAEAKRLLPILQEQERQRQARIGVLLAEAGANNSMRDALKGMESLKALFELDANHVEAKQLLAVLQERERERQARIVQLLAEAKASDSMEKAWKGLESIKLLLELDADHAEVKQMLPALQEQERRRQARLAELFAEAKATTSATNESKQMESLKALLKLDAGHIGANQLLAVLLEREREREMERERERQRQARIVELLAAAKSSNNMTDARKGIVSLKSLLELDANHAEAKKLLPVLQEEERRRQASITVLLAAAKANASPANAVKQMESLKALLKLDADHSEANQLLAALREREMERERGRQRQVRIAELLASAKIDISRKDAGGATKSLAELLQLDGTHAEARGLQSGLYRLISKQSPWENSLGMKFVHVTGTKVLFCIWETRLQDYRAFRPPEHRARLTQGPTEPVIASWNEAKAFCAWLTETERREGKITAAQSYRLPADWEWSVAVGLNEPRAGTPAMKSGRNSGNRVYPWGNQWPPPIDAGNYGNEADKWGLGTHFRSVASNQISMAFMTSVEMFGSGVRTGTLSPQDPGALCEALRFNKYGAIFVTIPSLNQTNGGLAIQMKRRTNLLASELYWRLGKVRAKAIAII